MYVFVISHVSNLLICYSATSCYFLISLTFGIVLLLSFFSGAGIACFSLPKRKKSLKCCAVLRHVNPTPNSCVLPSSQS